MGKLTISMAIFNSYVSSPEGILNYHYFCGISFYFPTLLGVAIAETWLLCFIFLRVDYRYTTHFPAKPIWSVGSKPNHW